VKKKLQFLLEHIVSLDPNAGLRKRVQAMQMDKGFTENQKVLLEQVKREKQAYKN